MKKLICVLSAGVMLMISSCGAVVVEEPSATGMPEETAPQELPEATPQDDFYRYINEDTLADAEFDYGAMAAAEGLDQHIVDDQLHELFDEILAGDGYAEGTEEYVISSAYNQYMDYTAQQTPQELKDLLAQIDAVSTVDEFMAMDASLLRDYGVGSILDLNTMQDCFVPGRNSLIFYQYSALLNVDFDNLNNNTYGLTHAQTMGKVAMMVAGHEIDESLDIGTSVAYMVLDIQRGSGELVMDNPDVYGYASSLSADELRDIFTSFDFDAYMLQLGLTPEQYETAIVIDTQQLSAINSVITEDNLPALKAWKISDLVSLYMDFYVADYGDVLTGFYGEDLASREDQAFDRVNRLCSDLVSPLYTERYYTQEADDMLRSMCDDIKDEYRVLIAQADWLTEETREGLIRKLEGIVYMTGIDDVRHDPSEYAGVIGNDWFETSRNISSKSVTDGLESLGPATGHELGMPMHIVNACYNPANNDITITVAIMNAPAFSVQNDYWTNLGGLGMIIAHEMGHAFDSNCILFDENGIYNPGRIPQEDMDILNERNEAAAAYFEDNFTVFGVYHVDGHQTLGENYADLGGMECLAAIAENATQQEREAFFENYARIWCEKVTDSAVTGQLIHDEHSPAVIRVNSILSTLDLFYETYGVTEGDGMYIDPDARISRWY